MVCSRASADSSVDPYGLFDQTRAFVAGAVYPPGLAYKVAITVSNADGSSANHYQSYFDSREDRVAVEAHSEEETLHPHVPPSGVNISILGFPAYIGGREVPPDVFGVPVLTPTFMFGIARKRAAGQAENTDSTQPATPLKTIGTVITRERDYLITLIAIEDVAGHTDYHLRLKPLRDPRRFRLRDLWIDSVTKAPDRLISDGNFTEGACGLDVASGFSRSQ